MKARSVLLEPWYSLRLEVPAESLGRVLTDIQRMGGGAGQPQTVGEETVIEASVPVAAFGDYAAEVAAYTKGRGRVSCTLSGYKPCPDQESVIKSIGYDPEKDLEDPPGSVFCGHGASFLVPWNEVESYMHLPALKLGADGVPFVPAPGEPDNSSSRGSRPLAPLEADKELLAIFERTYGPIKPSSFSCLESGGCVIFRDSAAFVMLASLATARKYCNTRMSIVSSFCSYFKLVG